MQRRARLRGSWLLPLIAGAVVLAVSAVGEGAGLGNYLLLVDTSGSMAACYAPSPGGGPSEVQAFVSTLVTDVMAPGDNLLIIPFDNEVHDDVASSAVIRAATPRRVAEELKRINLTTRPGYGTCRTAALGRGLQRLETFLGEFPGARPCNNAVLVISDDDRDVDPGDNYAQDTRLVDDALKTGALKPAKEVRSGPLITRIYQYRARGVPAQVRLAQLPMEALRDAINRIFGRTKESAAVLRDMSAGALSIAVVGTPTVAAGMAAVTIPVDITSTFQHLHVNGPLSFKAQYQSKKGKQTGPVACQVTVQESGGDSCDLRIAPQGSSKGVCKQSLHLTVRFPAPLAWYRFGGDTRTVTFEPTIDKLKLSTVALEGEDVEARLKTLGTRLYSYTPEALPPRLATTVTWRPSRCPLIGLLAAVLALLVLGPGLVRALHPPVKVLTLHGYWGRNHEPFTATLDRLGEDVTVIDTEGVSLCARREGNNSQVTLCPKNCLMQVAGTEVSELVLSGEACRMLSLHARGGEDAGTEVLVGLTPFNPPDSTAGSVEESEWAEPSTGNDENWLTR